jgi:hypothetical protein
MTIFVPPDLPLKVVRLRIRNAASRPRRLTATYFAEWVLGARRAETLAYVLPDVSVRDSCLLAETPWSLDFAGRFAFLAADRPLHGYTMDRVEMLGRGGNLSQPAGLRRLGLAGRVAPGLDPCAAHQVHVDLGPGEEDELSFFLGQAEDREQALELVRRMRVPDRPISPGDAGTSGHLLGGVRVHARHSPRSPCNGWLLTRVWLHASVGPRSTNRAAHWLPDQSDALASFTASRPRRGIVEPRTSVR